MKYVPSAACYRLIVGLCLVQAGGLSQNASRPQTTPIAQDAPRRPARIVWDAKTLTLVQDGGNYGRMIRLRNGELFCAFEWRGKVWTRRSRDEGKTWQPPVLAADFAFGNAANPEALQLQNGWLLVPYNERPRDGQHPFTIRLSVSKDGGQTWTTPPAVYTADSDPRNGCWEPAALQLPSGEIQLFFANESPYRHSDEQEITLLRSLDNGATWSAPQTVSFRTGKRDGMPVPLLLRDGNGVPAALVLAIEDNGLPTNKLQPALISTSFKDNWNAPFADGNSPRRRWAITPRLAADVYAGAPYICRLPDGTTLLSCQSDEGGRSQTQMVVYIGDNKARQFRDRSVPFRLPPDVAGQWNSLFVKDAQTVTALSSTTLNGTRGLWMIDGHIVRP